MSHVPDVAPTRYWAAASDVALASTIGASPPPAKASLYMSCRTDRQGLVSEALDTPRSKSASMTSDRVNDRWSTRSDVRVSAPDIAVDGGDRLRRGHQREQRNTISDDAGLSLCKQNGFDCTSIFHLYLFTSLL